MLQFANPLLLVLLPLSPIVFFWWLRRGRAAVRFADTRPLIGLPSGRAAWARWGSAGLRAAALLFAIIGAAGPRSPDLKTRIVTEGIAIMIVLDTSGSMEAPTFIWRPGEAPISRKDAAVRAIHLFVAGGDGFDGVHFEGRSTDRGVDAIGLVTFANWPQMLSPPTLNHSVLLHILDEARPTSIREEGSNIGDALALGLIGVEKAAPARKVMILISDGELNYPDQIDPRRKPLKPRQAAQLAANLGVPIYVVDTGGQLPPGASPEEVKQRQEGRQINEAVARITNGKVFDANDGAELLRVCQQIDKLERQPIVSNSFRRYHEFYAWFAALALAFAVLTLSLEQTVWCRSP